MPTPQFDPEKILDCARSIRPYLPELVGTEAETVDRQLADLLAQARVGDSVDAEILALLKRIPNTRNWAAEFLAPEQFSKGFERLPGSSGAISAQKFVCPYGDYVWYRRSAGIPVPTCPTHGALVPAEGV